jgi:hypothetical protein
MDASTGADPTYGYTAHLSGVSFDEARARTVAALEQEGDSAFSPAVHGR